MIIPKNPRDNHSQDVRLCYGYPLVAQRASKQLGIKKADWLVVLKCTRSQLELRLEEKTKMVKHQLKLTVDTSDFHRYFRPRFCVTLYQAQGNTLTEPYTILDWHTKHMGPRQKYVAVSRAVKMAGVAAR